MSEYKFEVWEIKNLIPYARNPRKNDHVVEQLASEIREFGFKVPLIIKSNGDVVDGHLRIKAAKKVGLTELPVLIADDLSDTQIKALRLAVNKISELPEWDDDLLALELQDLMEEGFEIDLLGFDSEELNNILAEDESIEEGLTDEDEVPEPPEEPITKLGDIWTLGNHRLMCGDSTSIDAVEKLMDGQKADMVFTDPPYNIDYDFSKNGMVQTGQRTARFDKIKNDKMLDSDFDTFIHSVFSNLLLTMKEGASYYISAGRESTQTFNKLLTLLNFHIQSWLIWKKENFNISRLDYHPKHEVITYGWKKGKAHNWYSDRSQTDVWEFERNKNAVHPTQKPVELIEYALNNSSKSGDTILDSFGGSGSTLIACEKTQRQCRMMELDPKYCDVIIKRWEDYTGDKATHIESGKTYEELKAEG